ncbi:MAG TPA: hypothetical protein VJL29_06060 [Thermoguttaceae bacterium]|nr:hypothetical protein [Thermoguttaceae bacterium]
MKYLIRDSARWAATGLATGVLLAIVVAAVAAMDKFRESQNSRHNT